METNKELLKRIKDQYNSPPGNDIEGMHRGIALDLGTYIPTLYRPAEIILWNIPDTTSEIELLFKFNNRSISFILDSPTIETNKEERLVFLDNTVLTASPQNIETEHYIYGNDAIIAKSTINILPGILIPVLTSYIKDNPWTILSFPDNKEKLVPAKNIEVTVTYNTYDQDGDLRDSIKERHYIDIPPIDQMENYINEEIELRPIYPNSIMVNYAIALYKIADKDILNVISEERYEEILNEIRALDNSSWIKTVADTTFFDEKYASKFLVQKTEFDSAEFDNERMILDT